MNILKKILHSLLVCSLTLGLLTMLEARRGGGRHRGRGRHRGGRHYGRRHGGGGYRGYTGSYYYGPFDYGWGPWGYDWPYYYPYGAGINLYTSNYSYETLHEFRDIYRTSDFYDVLNRNIFVCLKFYDNNAASRSMAEVDSYIMKKFSDKVRFIQVNVEKNKELFKKILGEHGQLVTPSYVFFINSKMTKIRKGTLEKRPFKLLVREVLKSE